MIFGAEGTAIAKTYATNYHLKTDGTRYDYFGVYEDELVKTPEGWRIKARKQYPLFTQGEVAPVCCCRCPRTRLVISQVVLSGVPS